MKRAAGLVMLFALGFSAFAATPNVQVKIQHFSATAPLDDQPVRLEAMSVAAPVAVQRGFTDENGQITFNSMPAGRYKLFLFHTPELEINIPDTSGTIQASSYVTTEGWTIATADDVGVIDLQTTQVLLLGNGLTKAGNTLQLSEDVALTGSLKLSGEDDELTVDGGELKLNGEAIGSGGETVWTNSAGIVKPAGGQALTNRLQFVSGAADNATNVVVVVDTAEEWTDANARLLSFQNNGVEKSRISPFGGLVRGVDVETIWGAGPSRFAIGFANTEAGEPAAWELTLGSMVGNDWGGAYSYGILTGNTNQANLELDTVGETAQYGFFLNARPDQGLLRLRLRVDATDVTDLNPSAAASDPIASFGSDKTHTSGNLFEAKNNATNKFAIAFDGATTVAQAATEPAAPAAGYFTLFATNNAGKMVLKVRFPTGASQTIATEP
jgi:hypothetical protein